MSFFKRNKAPKGSPNGSLVSMLSMNSSPQLTTTVTTKECNGLPSDVMNDEPTANQLKSSPKTNASISTISSLHSHRNVKPVHQMLLAESMYDPSVELNLNSRLNQSLPQVLSDNLIFPYFIQFMESLGNVSKCWIRFWIQTECLIESQKSITKQSNDHSVDNLRQHFITDSIGIYDKYLSESLTNSLDIPKEIKDEIKDKLINKTSEVTYNLFGSAQKYTIEIIEKLYFYLFLDSSYYCKFCVDFLTTESVTLADILFNSTLLATNFIEFMETEGMKSFIDFLIMFENYRKFSNDYDDAIALFNRFFSDDIDNKLGFSESLIMSLSEKLVKNNFKSDCLDRAAAILIQYFEKTYLKQFIQNQFFMDYLNKCLQSIQTESTKCHKRTNSDSSYNSESSFVSSLSSKGNKDSDALSGGSSLTNLKHKNNHLIDDLKSDTLWKRDLSGKLQFTHIDKYGRIYSEIESEPDKPTGSLMKVMKKFSLHSSQDKDKEEIAWKIAAMIVNDVTHTCNGYNVNTQQS